MHILKRFSWKTAVKNLYVLSVLLLIILIFSSVSVKFIQGPNIVNILRQSVPLLLIGTAVTLLMISGNIDLSVGGMLGLCSVVFSLLLKANLGYMLSSTITLILGIFLGYVNGLLVVRLRIVPVIATLATMSLCIGLGKLLSPGGIGLIKGLPEDIVKFARTPFFLGLPVSFYVTCGVIIILIILQRKTVLGKYAVAIGGNKTAAELSGINVVKTVWSLYILVGFCSALAGIARTSLLSLGDPVTGAGMELDAMIAVVLGGTSFSGGEGSVARTIVGVLIIMCLTAGMQVIGMEPYFQSLVKGIVLILAVVTDIMVKEKIED